MKAWQAAARERSATRSRVGSTQANEGGMFDDYLQQRAKAGYDIESRKCFFCYESAGKRTVGVLPFVGTVLKHDGPCQAQYNAIKEEY